MFRDVKSRVLAFDIEWVPDPESGKVAYELPKDMPDREVIEFMWEQGGATEEEPMPFLKTVLSKIVSISMVFRESDRDGATYKTQASLHSVDSDFRRRLLREKNHRRLFQDSRQTPPAACWVQHLGGRHTDSRAENDQARTRGRFFHGKA